MARKNFNISVEMEESWIPYFQSFLNYMQSMGNIGHSCIVAMYCDGDGDFRPKFDFDIPCKKVEGVSRDDLMRNHRDDHFKVSVNPRLVPEVLFDRG